MGKTRFYIPGFVPIYDDEFVEVRKLEQMSRFDGRAVRARRPRKLASPVMAEDPLPSPPAPPAAELGREATRAKVAH